MKKPPLLIIFSGLPGVGKTTLASMLARHLNAVFLRIDTVEHGLRNLFSAPIEGEGYRLSYLIAADQLNLGMCVVADSCNPIELTRREWREVATGNGASFVDIEIVCSNREEHRKRIQQRRSDIPGLTLPTWPQVESREYHPWLAQRLVIDTASVSISASFQALLEKLQTLPEFPAGQ